MAMKVNNPYERFSRGDLILRDELAIDRTILANERTLLAYIRTALAFAVTGAGIIKFFDGAMLAFFGSCAIAFAIGITAVGIIRYQRVSRRIHVGRNPAAAPASPAAPE
jgi:putative membrane protein